VDSFKEMQQQYFNFSSPQCQNDIINICSTAVQNEIVDAIRRAGFFTIIAAEARSSKTEYLSQCVRYADGLTILPRFNPIDFTLRLNKSIADDSNSDSGGEDDVDGNASGTKTGISSL